MDAFCVQCTSLFLIRFVSLSVKRIESQHSSMSKQTVVFMHFTSPAKREKSISSNSLKLTFFRRFISDSISFMSFTSFHCKHTRTYIIHKKEASALSTRHSLFVRKSDESKSIRELSIEKTIPQQPMRNGGFSHPFCFTSGCSLAWLDSQFECNFFSLYPYT